MRVDGPKQESWTRLQSVHNPTAISGGLLALHRQEVEYGAKLGIVVAVVLAFVLAGCTTSTAKPIGVVTGLTARCNILVPPVKISLYSGRTLVASATVPAGASYRLTTLPAYTTS